MPNFGYMIDVLKESFKRLEAENKRMSDRTREATQTIVECIGAGGLEDVESAATRIVAVVERLRVKLEEVERLRACPPLPPELVDVMAEAKQLKAENGRLWVIASSLNHALESYVDAWRNTPPIEKAKTALEEYHDILDIDGYDGMLDEEEGEVGE